MTRLAARPAFWMTCGAFAFALMAALTHALQDRCDWLVTALVRALFMLAAAVAMARAAGVRLVVFDPPKLWVRSVAGSFSLVCNFYAMTRLPVADVLTLTNAYPLWIVILSALLARRWPAPAEMLGVMVGFSGVVLIGQSVGAGAMSPRTAGDRLAVGVAVAGSVSSAVAMLGLHRLRDVDTRAIVAHFAGVASLVASAWLAARPEVLRPELIDPTTLLILLGVGISGTVGQFFLTRAYASGPPSEVSMVGLWQVVFGMGFDVLLWGRTITPLAVAGIALVLAPTLWLAFRARRKRLGIGRSIPAPSESAEVPGPRGPLRSSP